MKADWIEKPLGELTTKIGSGATPAGGEESYKESGMALIRSLNVYDDGFTDRKLARIDDVQAAKLSNVTVEAGDVLLNITGASVARCCLAPESYLPARVNQHVSIIRPRELELDSEFLHYLLIAPQYKDRLLHTGSEGGSTRQAITKAQLQAFSVQLPSSVKEQQRIVGILNEAFDGIATAKVNAEANFQNVHNLFDVHLQTIFAKRGDGWNERLLGDVSEVQSGGTPTVSNKEYWNGKIPWYSSGELNKTLTVDPERHISSVGLSSSNAKLFPKGSLLIGMYDTAALKMSILDRDGAFNQAIAGVKPNNHIEVEFILHAINAVKPRLLLERRGVRQKNLSLGKIKNISIPMPNPNVQRSVVAMLREYSNEIDNLNSIYLRKITALDELKKSLLQQAFTGHL